MSTLLLCVEAIGTRINSCLCPHGTAGRMHALQLRNRLRHASQPYATASAFESFGDGNSSHSGSTHETSDPDLQRQQQQQQQLLLLQSNESRLPDTHQEESDIRLQSTTTESSSMTTSHENTSSFRIQRGSRLLPPTASLSHESPSSLRIQRGSRLLPPVPSPSHGDTARLLPLQSGNIESSSLTTSHESPSSFRIQRGNRHLTPVASPNRKWTTPRSLIRKTRRLPPYLVSTSYGDTARLPPLPSRNNRVPPSCGNILRRALKTESPHAIIDALTRLITVSKSQVRGSDEFRMLSPNTFSEILRCLDPEYFVGRYLNLYKNNANLTSPAFTALRKQTKEGVYQFCIDFMARITFIIDARRSSGSKPSLPDYKYLLRCAAATENPKASQAVWLAMNNDGFEPDTECYNYYLSGILKISISNGTQRSELRSSFLPRMGRQEPSEVFRSHYERLGIDFKYETTVMLDDMLRRGITGDERTFCLLMISSARIGDIEGVKSILGRVWDINVDKLMTMNEEDITRPKSYQDGMGSPLLPSATLLLALAHCFGINNMMPTALRLVDYVSRMYSLTIPIEVWEDLLRMTYALSIPRAIDAETMKKRPKGLYLQLDAVYSLWSVMTAEPFNVKPNMTMYDHLISSLLRQRRFFEARKRIAEARGLYLAKMYKHKQTTAVQDFQSYLFEEGGDGEELSPMQGITAYENYQGLRRDKNFEKVVMRHSRQYICRWCRIIIRLAPVWFQKNPTFIFKDLPQFIYYYRLFMPQRIEYRTSTGHVSFLSDSDKMSRNLAYERKLRPWSHDNTTLSIHKLHSGLDSEGGFGRS